MSLVHTAWTLLICRWRTTDPPRLPIDHPIRRAFYRHGLLTARHWLLAMLVSVAIGVILAYPTVFLSDFPTAGLSGLPHHVWASYTPYEGAAKQAADLEMRQVWIHGSYMKALEKPVLKQGLVLQSAILGGARDWRLDANHDFAHSNWGWHSPLMLWNNSLDPLDADPDILRTINEHSQSSLSSFPFRPFSIFAGKSFSGTKLDAADALIISLFSRINDTMGMEWHTNLLKLANQASESSQYSISGSVEGSRLYEYRFRPLSFNQNSALALAYGIIGIYVAASLRRLKAFHSRFGLVVTALTQITTSVLASFTICGLLGINLAQIPQEAYPFVVLVIGLENIFRFINAVLAYPPEMMNTQRIANGLGDIGMASIASAAQNLVILWVMSMVVSPGVAAFCVFAAVALLFDYFFLFTFFLAVLSVDIRRLELQDSIRLSRGEKPRVKRRPPPKKERHSWVDALIQGRVPFSTRMAGSVVTISFVMVLNWHFTDHSSPVGPFRAFPGLFEQQSLPVTEFDGTPSLLMNQSRRPDSLLRTQDYENAVHFMDVVKPGATGFTVKIYDPLVIVLSGSDRTGIPQERSWLSALRSIALQHFYPTALAAVFVVAFVTVLMNFLLWDERAEGAELDIGGESSPLTVEAVETHHHLDIIKIAGCRQGHILTAGIDRTISIAMYDYKTSTYDSTPLSEDQSSLIRWPVLHCVIDGPSEWMALICDDGQVLVGTLATGKFSHDFRLKSDEKILAFRFIPPTPAAKSKGAVFVAIHADGSVSECRTADDYCGHIKVLNEDLSSAHICIADNYTAELLMHTIRGQVISHRRTPTGWTHCLSRYFGSPVASPSVSSFATAAGVEASFLCTTDQLSMFNPDNAEYMALRGVLNSTAKPASLEILHSGRGKCHVCRLNTNTTLSLAYDDAETKACNIATLAAMHDDLGSPLNTSTQSKPCECMSLDYAEVTHHRLTDPGAWRATAEAILGLRQRADPVTTQSANSQHGLLRRRRQNTGTSQNSVDDSDPWEAYLVTSSGDLHTIPVVANSLSENYLYATRAGPSCKLGPQAVAIALGSTIYVIQHGSERMDSAMRGPETGSMSRRRQTVRKAQ